MQVSRRGLLKVFAAAAATCVFGVSVSMQRFGAVSIERHRRLCLQGVHLHVFYQGCDVTRRCVFADDTGEGMAELHVLNAAGKPYWDPHTDRIVKEIVYGVAFKEGEPF